MGRIGTIAVAAALALLVQEAAGQVSQIQVRKAVRYSQTSATAVELAASSNRHSFHADIDGTNIGGIMPPMVSGPFNVAALGAEHNGGRLTYNTNDAGWRYGASARDFQTASKETFDSLFGNGTYTFTVQGNNVPLTLAGDAYPQPPVTRLSGGVWADGAYVVAADAELTIDSGPFAEYGTHRNDVICMFVRGLDPETRDVVSTCPNPVQRASEVPNRNFMTRTVAANQLRPGQDYTIIVTFLAIVDARNAPGLPGSSNTARYTTTTFVKLKVTTPVFPMNVTASFANNVANVSANIQFRPQDVGTTGSVFVFALAPAPLVKSAGTKAAHFGHMARSDLDTPVQCVLAQLSSSGQLTGVTASNMQAYVSGVLSGQGQAVTLLDGVPVANIAGSTFYVGYGPTASAMLDNGINRSAATAPGSTLCKPEPPETGWWWNPAEGGRGFSVEVQGNNIFFAAFHYDISGRSTWHVATGPTSLDGSLYSNQPLYAAAGGQTLAGVYRGRPTLAEIGKITLAFADKRTGTMVWPGGVVPIERFDIVPNGLAAAPKIDQPETGWWWNPEEDGRGFFMEWQNGTIDLAGYMYDEQGNPVWYLSVYETPNIRAMNGNWWSYANGQSMSGAYKPATRVSDNVAPVAIAFSGPDTAIMTLPGGRTTQLRRHRF